jgi:hypothetical protein
MTITFKQHIAVAVENFSWPMTIPLYASLQGFPTTSTKRRRLLLALQSPLHLYFPYAFSHRRLMDP